MAKLITNHDPYHIHKILGVLVLIHFLYRFTLLIASGTAFPSDEEPMKASFSIVLHGALSWSSLLLPLPNRRNFNSPMIWPEFRLHSILFASRHVVCSIISVNNVWPDDVVYGAFVKIFLIISTSYIAGRITNLYGCKEKHTTNAMPYPEWTNKVQQRRVKKIYSMAQFYATASCMFDDPTMNFCPLIGIQVAPLMMTLVRKGKCSSMWYHRVYSLALWTSFITGATRMAVRDEPGIVVFGIHLAPIVYVGRVKYRQPAWLLWFVHGVMTFIVYPILIEPLLLDTKVIHVLKYTPWLAVLGRFDNCLRRDIRSPFKSFQYWPFLTRRGDPM